MATPRSPSPRGDARLDSAPLLGGGGGGGGRRYGGALRRRRSGSGSVPAPERSPGDARAVPAGAGGGGGSAGGAAGRLGLLPPRGGARPPVEPRLHPRCRRRARAEPRREPVHAAPPLDRWVRRSVRPPHGLRRHRVPYAPRPERWIPHGRRRGDRNRWIVVVK